MQKFEKFHKEYYNRLIMTVDRSFRGFSKILDIQQ